MVKQFQSFLQMAAKQTGLSEDEIRKLLKERFSSFNTKDIGHYMVFLRGIKNEQDMVALEEKVAEPGCPYHPEAKTYGTLKWYGKWTKTPSWRCGVGGDRCFLRAKMDNFLAAAGLQPVDWQKVDAQ